MALSWTTLAMLFVPAARADTRLPAMARAKALNLQVLSNDSETMPPTMSNVAPMAQTLAPPPIPAASIPAKPPALLPREAMSIFIHGIVEDYGGNDTTFKRLADGYRSEALIHKWPSVSPKALSMALRDHGCTIDDGKRAKDGSRSKIVRLPSEIKKLKTKRRRLKS